VFLYFFIEHAFWQTANLVGKSNTPAICQMEISSIENVCRPYMRSHMHVLSGTEMSSEIATRNEQWPVLVWPKSGVSPGVPRCSFSVRRLHTPRALSTGSLRLLYLAPIACTIIHDIATSAKWATSVFLSFRTTMAPKFKSVCENVDGRVQSPSKSPRRRLSSVSTISQTRECSWSFQKRYPFVCLP